MGSFFEKPGWKITAGMKYFSWKFEIFKSYSLDLPSWKDKFETPRCEAPPTIEIMWLWFYIYAVRGNDSYWERWLWIHEYNAHDEQKAIYTWPWKDLTDVSTWFRHNE